MELNTSAIIFIVVFIIIIAIYIVRVSVATSRRAKLRNADPETRAAMMPDRPTFTATAREVGDRVFGPNQHGTTYDHGMRYERSDTGTFGYAQTNDRRAAVSREDPEGGDPELPAYNDSTTMPMPPPATYSSPITARHESRSTHVPAPAVGEAPPKYDQAPPIVRVL